MAQYKVLQDIEAEDKLLGPLTLRQFIYASIVIAIGFFAFKLITTPVWFLAIPLLPPFIFFGLLAAPFGHEQSSEVWLLGKIRYLVFSKKRVWDQEGIEHLVKVTAPKKIEKHYSDGLSKTEVKSRLKALASTMDTRGWVVKNVSTAPGLSSGKNNDRLLEIEKLPEQNNLAKPDEDVLDTSDANPRAASLATLVDISEQNRKRSMLLNMQKLSSDQKKFDSILTNIKNKKPAPPAKVQKTKDEKKSKLMNSPQNTINIHRNSSMTQSPAPVILNSVKKHKQTPADNKKDSGGDGDSDKGSEVVVSLH